MESPPPTKEAEALASLRAVTIPRLCSDHWTPNGAKEGLTEVARLRASLAAAQAVLIGVMATETGRDTTAAISRRTRMSGREAREATRVAEVVSILPGAEEALALGQVTAAHLAALAPIASTGDAPELLELAAGQSPEEFARTVQRIRIERDGKTWSERQHACRSVKFFSGEYGTIGMRALLPPVAGTMLKHTLTQIADEAWRAAHPERASILGGHNAEPYERRLADALVTYITGPQHPIARADANVTATANDGAAGRASTAEVESAPTRSHAKGNYETGAFVDPVSDDETGAVVDPQCNGEPLTVPNPGADDKMRASTNPEPNARVVVDPEPNDTADGRTHSAATIQSSRVSGATAERFAPSPPALDRFTNAPHRAAVIVTINADTLACAIVGAGPIRFTEAAALAANADLYAAIHDSNWAILNFGRNRRLASPLQRLAAIIRDGGCTADGCTNNYDRCELHHEPPWEQGGRTNLDELQLVCASHHAHRHTTGEPIPLRLRAVRRDAPNRSTNMTRNSTGIPATHRDKDERTGRSVRVENREIEVRPMTDAEFDAEFDSLTLEGGFDAGLTARDNADPGDQADCPNTRDTADPGTLGCRTEPASRSR